MSKKTTTKSSPKQDALKGKFENLNERDNTRATNNIVDTIKPPPRQPSRKKEQSND